MHKIVTALYFILAAPVAKGSYHLVPVFSRSSKINSSEPHYDAYINLNRQQHALYIEDYDKKIEMFKQNFASSLKVIDKKIELLDNTIQQTETQLNPLVVISEASKLCVNQYRPGIPSVPSTTDKIKNCINVAINEVPTLLADVIDIRNNLENYYMDSFESAIISCERDFAITSANYTKCVTNAVSDADAYTAANKRKFNHKLSVADCLSLVSIQDAIECTYEIEKYTISTISEATTSIDDCMASVDHCEPCPEYSCSNVYYIERSQIDINSELMPNPFYGRPEITDCLMLKINETNL